MIVKFGITSPLDDDPVEMAISLDDTIGGLGVHPDSWEMIPDPDGYLVGYIEGTDAQSVRDHLFDNPGMVTHLPCQEAILGVTSALRDANVTTDDVNWVSVDPQERDVVNADDFERFLADFYRCDRDAPAAVEDTHHTMHDRSYAPGERPEEG